MSTSSAKYDLHLLGGGKGTFLIVLTSICKNGLSQRQRTQQYRLVMCTLFNPKHTTHLSHTYIVQISISFPIYLIIRFAKPTERPASSSHASSFSSHITESAEAEHRQGMITNTPSCSSAPTTVTTVISLTDTNYESCFLSIWRHPREP